MLGHSSMQVEVDCGRVPAIVVWSICVASNAYRPIVGMAATLTDKRVSEHEPEVQVHKFIPTKPWRQTSSSATQTTATCTLPS